LAGHTQRLQRGFSLVEVLFALVVLSVAVSGLAHLLTVAAYTNARARATTYAAVLAQQKMEQLRGLAYGFDPGGGAVTDVDTDITAQPELPGGGAGLQSSPPGTLAANTVGYVDYVDASGASLGGAAAVPPPGTTYIRRWSVEAPSVHGQHDGASGLVMRAGARDAADNRSPLVDDRRTSEARQREDAEGSMTLDGAMADRRDGEKGFSLVETLLAAMLSLVVAAAVFALMQPSNGLFASELESATCNSGCGGRGHARP
jgi:prepilin-type N-terminal cleavage/methylation domain-containing protein